MIAKSWTRAAHALQPAPPRGHRLRVSPASATRPALAAMAGRQRPARAHTAVAPGQARYAAPIIGPLAAPPS